MIYHFRDSVTNKRTIIAAHRDNFVRR